MSVNGSSYFVLKLWCDFTESGLMPKITVFLEVNASKLSLKSHASWVCPEVLFFG
jgi:hypothetical protein